MIQMDQRIEQCELDIREMHAEMHALQRSADRIEGKVDSIVDTQSSILRRLDVLETDVGTAKRWLSKVWPLLTALFAGAAGKDAILKVLQSLG